MVVGVWQTNKDAAKLIPPKMLSQKIQDYTAVGLIVPNVRTYNMLLDGLKGIVDAHESPLIAEAVLNSMIRLSGGDIGSELHPNIVTINTVIDLWSNSGRQEAPERAEQLLKMLNDWYAQTGMEKVKPKAHVYSSVISVWSRSEKKKGSAGQRAHDLLKEMKQQGLQPNTITYGALLHKWS